jgi:hypothetical protein
MSDQDVILALTFSQNLPLKKIFLVPSKPGGRRCAVQDLVFLFLPEAMFFLEDKVRDIPYQSFSLKDVIYKEKNILPWRMEHH